MADDRGGKDTVVTEALERFEQSEEGSADNRKQYYEDTKFARMADQWPDAIKKQREQEARPVLTINKMPSFIRAVVNESRQNKPAIKVAPVDGGADEEHAQVIGGLVRSVERASHAEVAYDTAIDHAVTGGFGFFRFEIDYAHELSFDMEAYIRRIPNALMVHWDTNSVAHDSSDWEYAFVSQMHQEKDFKRKWPGAQVVSFEGDDRDTATSEQWVTEDMVRVSEYFLRSEEEYTLVQLAMRNPETGEETLQAVREEDLFPMAEQFFQAGEHDLDGLVKGDKDKLIVAWMAASGTEHRQERLAKRFKVTRRLISGVEELSSDDWPGSYIPICPVWGDEIFIDGKRHFRSMISDAKSPQQMFNFWRSASTELVALAPKTPWVGPKGFVPKGDENKWETANTRAHPYLEYEKSSGEPPRRQEFAGVPAGVLNEAAGNIDDMKSIMGIFDSSLGAQSNEVSGKAIMARERQGNVSNFHFIDNLNRAIRWGGQILVDIIPAVYSVRQSIRILGEDQKINVVNLTQDIGGIAETVAGGKDKRLYNLSIGKYDVEVKTGPSYATAREETRETLIEIMRQVPQAAPFISDVLLDHMDFVGADKVAERLKSMLPPEIRQLEDAADQSDDPEKAMLQQKIQGMGQEMQQMQDNVMKEIDKLKAENEALKSAAGADAMRAKTEESKARGAYENQKRQLDQADTKLAQDERRLVMEEDAYAAQGVAPPTPPAPTAEETWDYEQEMAEDQRAWDAEQRALDRTADIAKAIIGKADIGADDADDATAEALSTAADMVASPARARRVSYEDQASTTLAEIIKAVSAPRELIRDEHGNAVGSRAVVDGDAE